MIVDDSMIARAVLTRIVQSDDTFEIAAVAATLIDVLAPPDEVPRLWHAFNTVTANASVTRALEGSTGRRLLSFNEHSHLPRQLVTYR